MGNSTDREPQSKFMALDSIGGIMVALGLGIAALGGLFLLASRVPILNRLFNLPGDIRVENGNFSCFFPIVTMIILSLLLTVIANIIIRIFNR